VGENWKSEVRRKPQDNPKKNRNAVACGKEIKRVCSGMPVGVPGRVSNIEVGARN
jgi:hypothetical protein